MHLLSAIHEMEKQLAAAAFASESEIRVLTERVIVLRSQHGTLYLLGTRHNREQSALAAQRLLGIARPHVVAVELCRATLERFKHNAAATVGEYPRRASVLSMVPPRLKDRAVGEQLLLGLISESIKYEAYCQYRERVRRFATQNPHARRFAVRPKVFDDVVIGREMTVPFGDRCWTLKSRDSPYLVNVDCGYKIMLADRPVERTFCSIVSALSDEEKNMIQVYRENFLRVLIGLGHERSSLLVSLMQKNDRLQDAIVRRRDRYMARSLRKALKEAKTEPNEQVRVVGIVGRGHVEGILSYLHEKFKKDATRKRMGRHKTDENKTLEKYSFCDYGGGIMDDEAIASHLIHDRNLKFR